MNNQDKISEVQELISQALKIIKVNDPRFLMTPSLVLSLAGLRVIGEIDHSFFKVKSEEIDFFVRHGFICDVHNGKKVSNKEAYSTLVLMSREALKDLDKTDDPLLLKNMSSSKDYKTLYRLFEQDRKAKSKKVPAPEKSIFADYYYYYLYGRLYGYPIPAIVSMYPLYAFNTRFESISKNIYEDADISYGKENYQFSCGVVSYQYPKFLDDNSEIQANISKWSNFLTQFYENDWYKQITS